jgi:hypothetical protein
MQKRPLLVETDPTRPEFAAEAARQARLLRGRPEEAEALTFIEAAFPPSTPSVSERRP